MDSILKKTLYTGLGFLSIVSDEVKHTVNKLVNNEEEAQTKGQKVLQSLLSKLEDQRVLVEKKIGDIRHKVQSSKTKEVAILKARILELETQIAEEENRIAASKITVKEVNH